ncbi:MAG: hypothetical protein JW811_00490 [Clostridiales bacterium]|nr:hypothetical protein [Clostridiales bacterium]
MKLIDFDAAFAQALSRWIEENRDKYKTADAMEEAAPEFYLTWLKTPAAFLDGETPGGYFARYTDAQELLDLLVHYIAQAVPVPDPLLNRLTALGDEDALLGLAEKRDAPTEARMHAIDVLRELNSDKPMLTYIRWQAERGQDEDLLDSALESLRAMGEKALAPARIAFAAVGDEGKEALLDVLALPGGGDEVFSFAVRRFRECGDKRALYAGYLGKLEDERALEPLLLAAEDRDVSYVDFIEIRNAIERLGGEAPYRDFSDDPTYLAVQRLQMR